LSALERAEQIAEWVTLTVSTQGTGDKVGQVGPVSKGGRGKKGGVRAATKEIGVNRAEAKRAAKIAGISDDAKDAAIKAGLDDNQSARD
jgi:ParB family chromosome partitioning protein